MRIEDYKRGLSEKEFENVLKDCIDKVEGTNDLDWQEIVDKYNLGIHRDVLRKAFSAPLSGYAVYKHLTESMNNDKTLELKENSLKNENDKLLKEQQKELEKIKKEKEKYEKELDKLDSREEKRLKVIENGEYYTIASSKRQIKVSKEKVKQIKQLYCDENGIGISQLCRRLDIPRRDFMLIKYAFNIVHDDVPYLDDELEDDNLDYLVEETLERKKNKYFLKLQEEEINKIKQELKLYRNQDYLYDKIINKLNEIEINPTKYNVEVKPFNGKRSALLDLEDMHIGIKSNNLFNKYDVKTAYNRADELTEQIIKTSAELGITELFVNNLGDSITGIIHDSLIAESEIPVEDQVKVATEIIINMLVSFASCNLFEKVHYGAVNGNHGRITIKEKTPNDKHNFETFITWAIELALSNSEFSNKIIFEKNYLDEGVISTEIDGLRILSTHGHNDKFGKIVQDLILMFGDAVEIHTAHLHHNKSDEIHCRELFMGRSFAGTDTYAKDGRHTSKAGQRLYIYSNGQREFIKDIIF